MHWFGHVKRSELYTGQILELKVGENRSRGRPKKSWLNLIKDDLIQWNHQAETSQWWSGGMVEWWNRLKTASHTHAGRHCTKNEVFH